MKRIIYLALLLTIAVIILIGHIYVDHRNKKQDQIKDLENLLIKDN